MLIEEEKSIGHVRRKVAILLKSQGKEPSWTPFLDEVARALLASKRSQSSVVDALIGLMLYGIETAQDLSEIAAPCSREAMRSSLADYGVPPAISNLLYNKYVGGRTEEFPIQEVVVTVLDEPYHCDSAAGKMKEQILAAPKAGAGSGTPTEMLPKENLGEDDKKKLDWKVISLYTGIAGTCAVAAPLAVTAGVAALGFGSAGIAAGSTAASWMATYGGAVQAGSAIATCQSIGAAGLGTAATAGLGATGAASGWAATKTGRWFWKGWTKSDRNNTEATTTS